MALSVKLYRVVGKGKDRRYIPIDLGRRGRRSKEEGKRSRVLSTCGWSELQISGTGFHSSAFWRHEVKQVRDIARSDFA
jgi:hypothetical protein